MTRIDTKGTSFPEICEMKRILDEVDEFKQGLAFAYLHGMRDAERCREEELKEKEGG